MGACILGIDPGTQFVGWGCLWLESGRPAQAAADAAGDQPDRRPLAHRVANVEQSRRGGLRVTGQECGVLRLGRTAPLVDRLAQLSREMDAILERVQPQVMALEEAFTGRSVQAALRVGEARGVILAAAGRAGVSVRQFAPAKIKRVVAGHGAADKAGVAAMVGRLLGVDPRGVPADATDALAVALCCLEEQRSPAWQQGR